jgi:DNA primase large subunit
MIKRNLSYYLCFEDRRDKVEKLCIYPEHMFELLKRFEYIKNNWIENDLGIYAFMDSSLIVSNYDEFIMMRLPMDKIIKITPGVLKTDIGDIKCIDFYFNSAEPVHVTHNTFLGMYYVLLNFDMLNYANTSLSFMMLMNNPINRTDFSQPSSNQIAEDTSTANGTARSFNVKRKSFFDNV